MKSNEVLLAKETINGEELRVIAGTDEPRVAGAASG